MIETTLKLADARTIIEPPLLKRIADLEASMRTAIAIIDANLYRQSEKVEDAASVLRRALSG